MRKTYEILYEDDVLRKRFETTKEALEWGKALGATSLIRISNDGMPVGRKIYNPQTGEYRLRSFKI